MFSLKEKVCLITGGSSGIGKALALLALERGALVAVCGREIGKLKSAYENQEEETLLLVAADVSKEEDCRMFVDKARARWGRIDILINNAGISMRALFEDVDVAVLKELMDINFWGAVYCTKAALPEIRRQKGVIAGVSSIAGYRGLPARSGYSASKFALQGFLETIRTELLETGVHVMWVAPGFTNSNIRNTARNKDGNQQKETPLKENELMSAQECAQIIWNAVEKRKRTVVMTMTGKATVFLNKILPGWVDKLVLNFFRKEENAPF